ncbi:MAG: glycosyltransferase family 4 protein [Thermodesulfovibrionales bacterium]|nr:glycosyltransferase family 4 protein [Thermodesulfovibrionales bacterium]
MQNNSKVPLIYAVLPVGSYHGWGVCGKYIVKELSNWVSVKLISEGINELSINDELDYRLITSLLIDNDTLSRIKGARVYKVDTPVIQSIVMNTMMPLLPNLKGTFNLGYTFFEEDVLTKDFINNACYFFDVIATGSKWNEDVLKSYGIQHTTTIIQGIDPVIFNPLYSEKEYFRDRFVIFSGGKFELRKGQDIVIKAFRYLQDKYDDILLVTSWFNHWQQSINTMLASPYITFNPTEAPFDELIKHTLSQNGIDLKRVIVLPPMPNIMLSRIYKNTDIGLFTNRCEGGTNLVMMEYMACGKPVIASFNTGHKDVLNDKNSIPLIEMKEMPIFRNNDHIATWYEPSLDEVIAKVEYAYQNQQAISKIGTQAGRDLSRLTWRQTAQRFLYTILRANT